MKKKLLIIGGGFAGCCVAHLFSNLDNWETTIIEKNNFLGDGVRTNWYGGHPYTFGPRHFLTPYDDVYKYLNEIIPLRSCAEHEFLTYVERDNDFYAYPINMSDVKRMPDYDLIDKEMNEKKGENFIGAKNAKNLEDYWIGSVGNRLFDKFIDKYNKKMWLVDDCKEIDTFNWSPKGVTLKDGPRAAWTDIYSGYPYAANGYNDYFDIATKEAKVYFNTSFESIDLEKKEILIDSEKHKFDMIVNTISPDLLFERKFGKLNYLGREFHKIIFPVEEVFPKNVYFLYYANDEKFTRLVEYKKFTHHKSPTTLVGMEIPVRDGPGAYPLPFKKDQELAKKYFNLFPEDCYSLGRAGSYLYGIDIDDCIRQAMILCDTVKSGSKLKYPVPGDNYKF